MHGLKFSSFLCLVCVSQLLAGYTPLEYPKNIPARIIVPSCIVVRTGNQVFDAYPLGAIWTGFRMVNNM